MMAARAGVRARVRLGQADGRWVLVVTAVGSRLVLLEATVVTVALPTLERSLDASLAGLQWTVNAFTLTLSGLILLGGGLGDRFGRRRVYLVGVVWFAAASLLCGVAPSMAWLIAARALQGVGGALVVPGSLALIQGTFHPDDRARAVGWWSGLSGVAGAAGPLLGGGLLAAAGWRWVFLINVPIALVLAVLLVRQRGQLLSVRRPGRNVLPAADPAADHGRIHPAGRWARPAAADRADPGAVGACRCAHHPRRSPRAVGGRLADVRRCPAACGPRRPAGLLPG